MQDGMPGPVGPEIAAFIVGGRIDAPAECGGAIVYCLHARVTVIRRTSALPLQTNLGPAMRDLVLPIKENVTTAVLVYGYALVRCRRVLRTVVLSITAPRLDN